MSIGMIVVKGEKAYDMRQLIETVKWSGRRGSAARSLAPTFIDDGGYNHDRTGIDVEQGHQCIFSWKGTERFRGMFMRQVQSQSKKMSTLAYDRGIYLANNTDSFQYENVTASEVFRDCCGRFQIPMGAVAETGYRIPELVKPKTTAFDTICDALSTTYMATGARFFVMCEGEQVKLIRRREQVYLWVVEAGVNLSSYNLTKSIENVKTRVKLLSKEGAVLAQASDTEMEKKIGIFQTVSTPDEGLNEAQLTELTAGMLKENGPDRSLSVTGVPGIPELISGVGVYIIIKELGISQAYYIEEDAHTFQGNLHTMDLKLTLASDFE